MCTVNGKFHLITSLFTYFSGIPVFESTDLISRKQIGHGITRKKQGVFFSQGVSKGIFAPTIRYNNGTFYVICTNGFKRKNSANNWQFYRYITHSRFGRFSK
ncbi:family 43 glycosylhydrolase [Mariniflexile sp. HMF6888]|uniref:family 43 glycosylhydrolase n=1 Tax=Mariniflexile sp. HMF6888 TaxID=3373086 RepID=UPI0037951E29